MITPDIVKEWLRDNGYNITNYVSYCHDNEYSAHIDIGTDHYMLVNSRTIKLYGLKNVKGHDDARKVYAIGSFEIADPDCFGALGKVLDSITK